MLLKEKSLCIRVQSVVTSLPQIPGSLEYSTILKRICKQEYMQTPQGKAQREQLIRQAIENHDFEILERLGMHVQPLYVDPKQCPS